MKNKLNENKITNSNSSSSFKDSFYRLIGKSKKLEYHTQEFAKAATDYNIHFEEAMRNMNKAKNHLININYHIEIDNYIRKYHKPPSNEYKRRLYQELKKDSDYQFSIKGSSILSPFKRKK